jgi:pimeloyl-ACP methyl ester carboxylesterase
MDREADLSPPGLARMVDNFLSALKLQEATLVANDGGGAIAQVFIANHPERISRLVLTNCGAFEDFLPPALRPLQYGVRLFGTGFIFLLAQALRFDLLRHLFVTTVAYSRLEPETLDSYFTPLSRSPEVRRDVAKVFGAISSRYTIEAAKKFANSLQPVLIVWGEDDPLYPLKYAKRLQAAFPNATLKRIPGSKTFVPEDQPRRLAGLIEDFLAGRLRDAG